MIKKISKSLIKEHTRKLQEEKVKLLSQIVELRKDDPFSDPDHASDNAAIDTDVREQVGHETIMAQIKDLQRKMKEVEMALETISKGKYGYCVRCGQQIPFKRLQLIPEARYCVTCERELFN